ncbi:MAG: Rieske (2Fe-2S) protein [Halobacteria archaeon]
MSGKKLTEGYTEIGSVDEVSENTPRKIDVDGRKIALFHHDGGFHATSLRCPHMGFPLTDGSVEDGLLTCPWHHARFEVECGDTLDPFADDVQTYPTVSQNGTVYVNPTPKRKIDTVEHWRDRLQHGLREGLSLVTAKAVIGLLDRGVEYTVPVQEGVEFGTQYRSAGWGSGLTTLGVMANLYPEMDGGDRERALYVGLSEVADDCFGEPPFFPQEPLSNTDVSADRLESWFRENIEVRDSDGAERVVRAAVRSDDVDRRKVTEMLVAAGTDHVYLDGGHTIDFVNKALETLDHVGWSEADVVIPSLVPGLAEAARREESSTWRQPIDLVDLRWDFSDELPELLEIRDDTDGSWSEPEDFVDVVLGEDPHAITEALRRAVNEGASASDLSQALCYAAAIRVVQFGTSNEFRDWNTVHHTYTYNNAVLGLAERVDSPEIYRGVADAALKIYLDRFLNTPPAEIPEGEEGRDSDEVMDGLMETFEREGREEVDRAGRLTATYLESGGDIEELKQSLGHALLREDVGFHGRQNLEAAFNLHRKTEDPERAEIHLVATSRYLSAHTPTRRSGEQTFQIARRLHQGERIHEG